MTDASQSSLLSIIILSPKKIKSMSEQLHDIEIRCSCGNQFTWTAGEQKFMQSLLEEGKVDVINRPKRCPECRAQKKAKYGDKERQHAH